MTVKEQEPESSTRAPHAARRPLWKRRWPWMLVGLAMLLALDLARPAPRQLTTRAVLAGVDFYQAHISRRLGDGKCRMAPTCSVYVETSIRKHGLIKGGLRGAGRILRCGPWTERGTVDEP